MSRQGAPAPEPEDEGREPAPGLTETDVQRIVREALATGTTPPSRAERARTTQAQQGADIAGQVEREVARIAERERTTQLQKELDERLKQVEEKAKDLAAAPPVQFRKITQRLWGDR